MKQYKNFKAKTKLKTNVWIAEIKRNSLS